MNDGDKFFDQLVKNDIKRCENFKKIATLFHQEDH